MLQVSMMSSDLVLTQRPLGLLDDSRDNMMDDSRDNVGDGDAQGGSGDESMRDDVEVSRDGKGMGEPSVENAEGSGDRDGDAEGSDGDISMREPSVGDAEGSSDVESMGDLAGVPKRSGSEGCGDEESESDGSDRAMDKAPQRTNKLEKTRNHRSPMKRPRKRLRKSTSSEDDNEDVSTSEPNRGGTRANPIDVDLFVSKWDPMTVTDFVSVFDWFFLFCFDNISFCWQVEIKEPDFVNSDTVQRVRSETEIRAFDADGGEHRFTPESHVSFHLF